MTHLKRYVDYIYNTNRTPLPSKMFDEDWEPAGPRLRAELQGMGFIEQEGETLSLTDSGLKLRGEVK